MKIFNGHIFALLACALILCGCSHATHPDLEIPPAGARLTSTEAIRIAQQTAVNKGIRLGDYQPPEPYYEFTRKDRSWWVVFEGKVPMPGIHFALSIDDPTGKAELSPGR